MLTTLQISLRGERVFATVRQNASVMIWNYSKERILESIRSRLNAVHPKRDRYTHIPRPSDRATGGLHSTHPLVGVLVT